MQRLRPATLLSLGTLEVEQLSGGLGNAAERQAGARRLKVSRWHEAEQIPLQFQPYADEASIEVNRSATLVAGHYTRAFVSELIAEPSDELPVVNVPMTHGEPSMPCGSHTAGRMTASRDGDRKSNKNAEHRGQMLNQMPSIGMPRRSTAA